MAEEVKKISAKRLERFNKTDDVAVAPIRPRVTSVKNKPGNPKDSPNMGYLFLINEKPLPDNPIFHSPMVLVSTVDGKTTCNESTLSKLREIQQPLNIVSIVGTLRTGKSFLLNKLAGNNPVINKACFEIGHTTAAVTKGIWVMCRPHPIKENEVVVLLDTEGIDDPDKVDIEDDKNLFILATLLSNTLVYNTRGDFERTAIDKFKFLGRIKTSIRVNGTEEDDSILDFFFPNFVLTLRDVTLDSKTNDDDDAFLEKKLGLKCGDDNTSTEVLEQYNLPRKLIRRYFKKRKCFRFRKPIKNDRLKKMLTLDESELKSEFKKKLDEFRSYIFSCKPKSMKSGKAINGRMLCSIVLNYVHSIRNRDPPCLTSAMVSMAASENTFISQRASEVYKAEMQRRIASHIPSELGIVNYHKDSMRVAIEVLKEGLIIDDEQIYEEQAMVCFKDQFEKFKSIVKKDTASKCWEILGRIDKMKIQVKIKNRKYSTPTGYDEYMADINSLIKQFNREAGYMGSLAMSALQDFLSEKSTEEENVYKMVQEALGGKEGPERKNIKRLSVFKEEDADILKKEENFEEAIRADIDMLQQNGLQSISEQYLDMLKCKIEELERVKQELGRTNSHYKKLCREASHWKNIFDKATFNSPQYGKQPVAGQEGADLQATVYDEPWDNVIKPLWKRVIERGESEDEDDDQTEFESAKRAPPEGSEADNSYVDQPREKGQTKGQAKPVKCTIL